MVFRDENGKEIDATKLPIQKKIELVERLFEDWSKSNPSIRHNFETIHFNELTENQKREYIDNLVFYIPEPIDTAYLYKDAQDTFEKEMRKLDWNGNGDW